MARLEKFSLDAHSDIISAAFEQVERNGNAWMVVHTFTKYVQHPDFEHVFLSQAEYEQWLYWSAAAIKEVTYDWTRSKAIITLSNDEVYEFDCTENWTYQDCLEAIQGL